MTVLSLSPSAQGTPTMQNTYWNKKGKYQELADRLFRLIPHSGECEDKRGSNRRLEKFRKAGNCYYDLYNNLLGNRAAEFRAVFGFGGRGRFAYSSSAYRHQFKLTSERVEPLMDEIILAAAKEQGII